MRPDRVGRLDWIRYNFYFVAEHILGPRLFDRWLSERKLKLFNQIDQKLGTENEGRLLDIEIAPHDLTPEAFKKISASRNEPLLFKGVAHEWNSTQEWDFDFFERNYGEEEIMLNDNSGLNAPEADGEFEVLKLKDYIQLMRSGSLKYLKFSMIADKNPELKEFLNLEWLRKFKTGSSWREETNMFMGAEGTKTPIHVGFSGNFFNQIMGQKKWVLWQPNERMFIDPRAERVFYFYSKANPHQLNDPNFPLIKHANRYEVILEPGDILWVPPFTWHHVENITHSIGLAYRFSNIRLSLKSSKVLTSLIFMATKPNIISHYWHSMTTKRSLPFTKAQKEL